MSFVREPNAEPIPGYRLIEPLGSGGFGEVWKCEAPGGLFKAIKFVYGNLNTLDVDGIRAEQEFNALKRVKEVRHPFVLSMDRMEVVDGELVIVMELADRSLHDAFVEHQAAGLVGVPRDSLLRYIRDAAEALDHMIEKHNLQHLDVKPRNLFLVSDRVKVADFGLVKHLERHSGTLAGATPAYAAPETILGKISQHSDQYSLAIVYQEMLTGQRPFSGKNARQLAMQHIQEEPELRALPEPERPVVARALAKDPAQRFPNCLAFVRALYLARAASRPVAPAEREKGADGRPRTLPETLEDVLLEDAEEAAEPAVAGAGEAADEVSQLGITIHQPDTGVLRPTLVVGLGGFGRRAVMELRCRYLDRFGGLEKIPVHHFLYLDTDAEAVRSAVRGAPEVALSAQEVYHVPLQAVGNYRKRLLEHLSEWLPREKLYAMPRSLQTQGCRALGRLAFADNHLRVMARLRRELSRISHPDALYRSVSETGLALRENRPRVYVIAAAGGGSSGMLIDLGYSLRRLLDQLHHPDAEVTAFLFCGAPEDPATPRPEQANVYATLTELNHFCGEDVRFAAQYGADGPRVVGSGPPFAHVYLLKLAHRDPEALRTAVAHLGSYVFHELTTPLGLRLDRSRRPEGTADGLFRSFGTYAVWFPRGLLLRRAARQACLRLVREWQAAGEPTAQAEVEASCARMLSDPGLRFEALCAEIERAAAEACEGDLGATLTGVLSQMEEQSQQVLAQDDPAAWSRQALGRIHDWLGPGPRPGHETEWRKSRLGRALAAGVQRVAEQWEARLVEAAVGLMEFPGRRVAAAEAALARFARSCQEAAVAHKPRLDEQAQRTQQAGQLLERAFEQCRHGAGGFSFFGSRARRALRVFVDHLAAFSRQRLAEDLLAAGLQFYAALHGRLEERIQDLSFCRQRLRHLSESLDPGLEPPEAVNGHGSDHGLGSTPFPSVDSYWDAIRQSETARLVLPEGETDLEGAALGFVDRLSPEQWTQLDQALQDRVLGPRGGLHRVCMTGSDLARGAAAHLVGQAAECLGEQLPVTDVAQAELSAAAAQHTPLADRVRTYYESAEPLVPGEDEAVYLLAPASDGGRAFGEEAVKAVPELDLVRVPGQANLMFCREHGKVNAEELQHLLGPCRRAYQEAVPVPTSSPHSRFDILDWMPVDP